MVEEGESAYSDILSKVRPVLINNEGREAIKRVKSTKEGKLLITLDKDKGAYENIKQSIDSLPDSLKVRGVEGAEKTSTLFNREIGDREITNIGQLRSNSRNTKAVTITVKQKAAGKMLKTGKIRVGIASCLVYKKISVPSCRKCLSMNTLQRIVTERSQVGYDATGVMRRGTVSGNVNPKNYFALHVTRWGTKEDPQNARHLIGRSLKKGVTTKLRREKERQSRRK